jgi:DNA-binding response OmpR family regulator
MKKILIIEDEELLINILQKKLTEAGYEVFWRETE